MPDTSHQDLIRCSCVTLWPVPRPIRRLVASSKESQEMARMSMFLPCCWRKAEVILLPLLTMETDSIPIWKGKNVSVYHPFILSNSSKKRKGKKEKEKEKRKRKLTSLQKSTIFPKIFGYKNGSPPAKLIFRIPASFNIRIPFKASSKDTMCEVVAVWKQKPQDMLHCRVKW